MQPRLLKHPARLAGASLLRLQDDNRLVALAREGHDPAFAAIVDRYGAGSSSATALACSARGARKTRCSRRSSMPTLP